MNGHVARTDDTPAAFGLHAAKAGAHARHRIRHAARMRHGIEAVRSRHGPDAHRLKENIKTRVTRHNRTPHRGESEYSEMPVALAIYRSFNSARRPEKKLGRLRGPPEQLRLRPY